MHTRPLRTPLAALALLLATAALGEEPYRPADQGQRPAGSGTRLLPEQFLRGFDPITAYFPDNVGPGQGPADDGAKRLKIAPAWPGAWVWADKKTLQFRPAEPWPALARFAVDAGGAKRVLTTMMSAPQAMSPASGSDNLRPFRTLTLTFPQALPGEALKKMIKLEVRDLPGLADSPRHLVKGWSLAELPRSDQRAPAVYALTLDEDVPEGKQLLVQVSLALGDEDKVLWTGRASTRLPFHLESVQCGASRFALSGGASVPRDMALNCGNAGELPQLVFSAPVREVSLTELKKLVRLEPAVPDLHAESYGTRVSLKGKFVPDTLYKLKLGPASLTDDADRKLAPPAESEVYFYLGWKSAFLRWSQSTALVEANGPRMLPLVGYGDARADVRVYRIDPLYAGLWPFPRSPVVVNEQSAPPFPGEEPASPKDPESSVEGEEIAQHLRLLGSPLVSKVVDLPLAKKSGTTHFGLDLAPLLDEAVGKNRPGTYLVGVRRLSGPPQRSYVRVQVTNLSLTAAEERDRAVLFVRTLDTAEPVRGAVITLEGLHRVGTKQVKIEPAKVEVTTDAQGRAELRPLHDWTEVRRLSVRSGEDYLVLDPSEPPPRFASDHWGVSGNWLGWLTQATPGPENEKDLGFVFTERPIYKPGEPVLIKGYARRKVEGALLAPVGGRSYHFKVDGPGNQSWELKTEPSALFGFSAEFNEKEVPTGRYTVSLVARWPNGGQAVLASRSFQIEAYRVPTFEVRFAGPQVARLDAPFKTKAIARYYAGGSVAGQPIRWTVTRRPYHYVPAGREGFLFASSLQFARPEAARAPEAVTRTGTLNDDGADELSINPALDVDGSARIYHFEAVVTGPDEQEVAGTTEVKALPPFVMGMKLARYSEKATDIRPEVIAVGVDDKLLKGQEVTVRLFKRVWHSHLRETNFSTGEAKYVTEQEDVKQTELTIKTDDKPVVPTLPVKEAGVYVVELTSRDKLGRVQSLSADLYVGGPQPVAWQKSRDGVFELTGDKKTYRPGDTAKLIVQSPFQQARALVIVEEPSGNTYQWVEVSGGKAVVPVRIEAHHVPNLPVHVVLMRGRLGESAAARGAHAYDDARYRPQTLAASYDLEVEPVRNEINVAVSHPDVARPGSKIEVAITLTDEAKKPLSGEVTLWLVDEAVLSLAREETLDPLSAMIDRNKRTTSVRDTRNTVIGKLAEQEEEPGGDGDEGGENGAKTRVVRKNFKTVPFYQATLQVPASGRLVVPVTLSDDLTNFKVRAVAASGVKRFGLSQTTLHVRLPVIVQPQLPRFVRTGDKFWAGGIARLVEGAEGPGAVDVAISGPVDGGNGKQSVDLKSNKPASVLLPVTVKGAPVDKEQELTVRVGVTRKSDGVGDAFEMKLPVLPDRRVEHVASYLSAPVGPLKLPAFPERPREGTGVATVSATTVPGIMELISALDYLGDYPHGCLEQQMSQLYPQVAQGILLEKLGIENRARAVNAAHVKKLLADLALYQDEQGLFGFWPGTTGSVQLTAEFVDFLQDVRKAGIAFDEKYQARAIDALKRSLRSDYPGILKDFRYNQQTEALRTLARYGQLDEHYVIELFHKRGEMDASALATLALAMDHQPQLFAKDLESLKGELWDTVVFKLHNGQPVFEGLNWRRTYWGWGYYLGDNVSTVSLVFRALIDLDERNPKLGLLRDALLSYSQAARGWGNTYDNRHAIAALAAYLDRAQDPVKPATVSLSGKGTLAIDGSHKVATSHFMMDEPPQANVQGSPVKLRVAYTYLPAATGDKTEPLKQGFIVGRSATLVHADGSQEEHFDDQAGALHKLAVGDILEIHAKLTTDERRANVALVVPFAAGLEPLNPELANAPAEARPAQSDTVHPSYTQRLDSEVRYYFNDLEPGTYSLHFRVRAATEGSFIHPAPYAELMYREEVRGRGEGMRIVVSGGHEK